MSNGLLICMSLGRNSSRVLIIMNCPLSIAPLIKMHSEFGGKFSHATAIRLLQPLTDLEMEPLTAMLGHTLVPQLLI